VFCKPKENLSTADDMLYFCRFVFYILYMIQYNICVVDDIYDQGSYQQLKNDEFKDFHGF